MEDFKFVKTITVKNLTIADEALENLFNNQLAKPKFDDKAKENEKNIQIIKSRQDLLIVVADDKMFTSIPIFDGNSIVLMPLPELITFYLNSVISLYNQSNLMFKEMKSEKKFKLGNLSFIDPEEGNSYFMLMLRVTVFSYLSILIEFVLNKNLPDEFEEKGTIHNKKSLEINFDIKTKIKLLIACGKINFSASSTLFQQIDECYNIRSEILHPKVSESKVGYDNIYNVYPEAFNKCHIYIKAVIDLIEILEPNLLEFIDD